MKLKKVKVVLGKNNYHLLFPVECREGKRNKNWVDIQCTLPKHEVAQVAARSHVSSEADGLGAQLKTWFCMESYATRVNVTGRLEEDKRAVK